MGALSASRVVERAPTRRALRARRPPPQAGEAKKVRTLIVDRSLYPPFARVADASRRFSSRSASTVALVLTVGIADMPGRKRPVRL
ncbi:hypothetical protein SAMN05216337_103026 [Bradyrhizobium brasilense]|uniref:Uncharacterized protein n=1 Tax=Bradyrhizobium brasilense TaxID=1419277 RepID=A0A1G7EBC7_9BRAD|nr:hypothetical protein SAMN05216337_103026 [Bradyrhizobium brasilense]